MLARETAHTGSSGQCWSPPTGPAALPTTPTNAAAFAGAARPARSLRPSAPPWYRRPGPRTGPDDHERLPVAPVRAPAPGECVSPPRPGEAAATRYATAYDHHATWWCRADAGASAHQ